MEKGDGDEAMTAATEDVGDMGIQIIDTKIKTEGEVEVKVKGSITRIGDVVKRIFQGGRRRPWEHNDSNNRDRDNRDRQSEGQNNSNRGRRWDGNRGQNDGDRG